MATQQSCCEKNMIFMRHHIAALLFCASATAQNSSPCPKVNVLDQSNAANISMPVELVSGCSVRARPGRFSALSVFHSKYSLHALWRICMDAQGA